MGQGQGQDLPSMDAWMDGNDSVKAGERRRWECKAEWIGRLSVKSSRGHVLHHVHCCVVCHKLWR